MKVSVQHEGRLAYLVQSPNSKYILSENAKFKPVEFIKPEYAIRTLEEQGFFGIPEAKFSLVVDSVSHPITKFMKPYQKKLSDTITSGGTVVIDTSRRKGKSKVSAEAILASQLSDSLKKSDQEIKRLKKELEKKPTVDEALDVLANEYIMNPVEIYEAIRIYNREKNYPDPVDKRHLLQASEIGEQYCLEMSQKIADFIKEPARRPLIGIMAIEKAAGIPTSTISNFISAKRDRIPLHHIGSIVKVLEVIGFKA